MTLTTWLCYIEQHFTKTKEMEEDKEVFRYIIHRLDKLEAKTTGPARHDQAGSASGQGPTAADFNSLSDMLQHLSMAMAPDSPKTGMMYRPEYHVQILVKGVNIRQMNALSMRSEELLYGMLNVYMYLLDNGKNVRHI